MFQTFLNILGVIGIVIVAAFVIVFLSDLFISIVDGTNGIFFKRNKDKNDDYDDEDEGKKITKRPVLLNKPHEEVEEEEVEEERTFKKKTTKKEVKEEVVEEEEFEDEEEKEVDFDEAEREAEQIRKQNANRQTVVEQRAQQPQKAVVTPPPAPAPKKEEKEEDIDNLISEISKQTLAEIEKQTELNNAKAELNDAKAGHEAAVAKQKELEEEIERLKSQIESDKNTIKDLEEKLENQPEPEIKTVKVAVGNKQELEDRLEVLIQRLKDNEKELSANRKEYNPLRRVNLTLENDKKKLRRKEAIVAKQKVVLYGVNNYVDIDEEKAKKLSEELDLLEGLRLSVQHCEEVMQKNKDRYPILERTNKFLVKSNGELKEDIARVEAQLAELEANADDESGNENE